MTGKDEWRLIHIQNGVLTDSKNSKETDKDKDSTPNAFIQEMASLGTSPTGPQGQTRHAQTRQRSSPLPRREARALCPIPTIPMLQGRSRIPVLSQSRSEFRARNQDSPPLAICPLGFPCCRDRELSVSPFSRECPRSSRCIRRRLYRQSAGAGKYRAHRGRGEYRGAQPVYPGQQQFPGAPGMPVNSQTGGVSPYPTNPGANGNPPGFGQPGTNQQQNNQAIGLINGILTSPRPGGLAGIQGGNGPGGSPIGGAGGMGAPGTRWAVESQAWPATKMKTPS